MRRSLLLLLFPLLACGAIDLEGPEDRRPAPSCEASEVFDPETGRCLAPPCVFDEDCPEGERCDRIDGVCR